MNATLSLETPAASAVCAATTSATAASARPCTRPRPRRQTKTAGGKDLGQHTSRDARRLAAAILEVLAGARTPTEAAAALGLSVPRYYQVESRALKGLVSACEAKPKGRVRRPEHDMSALRQENQRLQREITRQQSLTRAAQRTAGWTPTSATLASTSAKIAGNKTVAGKPLGAKTAGKKTRRRRVARALSVAARLQESGPDAVLSTDVPSASEGI